MIVLSLGWRPEQFGLGKSQSSVIKTILLWAGVPIVFYTVAALLIDPNKLIALIARTNVDVFRNGFSEEILWRGCILRCAISLFGLDIGIVLQALAFGLWHLGVDLADSHSILSAIVESVATQSIAGYVFALLTIRTGNVAASSVFHSLYDAGQVFT